MAEWSGMMVANDLKIMRAEGTRRILTIVYIARGALCTSRVIFVFVSLQQYLSVFTPD